MYDLVIIGGGPGGLTAGIYAQRAGLKTLLVEKLALGGQIAVSDVIENYPGFPSISGPDLMAKFEEHARSTGLEIKLGVEVIGTDLSGKVKTVKTSEGDIETKAIIVGTGASPSRLGVPGEVEFTGKGVSYCATCDGPFFRNQEVFVIGGGDTAVKEAHYLSKLASKVYVVHRRDQLRAEKILQDKVLATENIEVLWSHVLKKIEGDKFATGLTVEDLKTGEEKDYAVEGIFVFVGVNPTTGYVDVEKDQSGFIVVNKNMESSVAGVYAIGDARDTPLKQVATAVGDGAIAAFKAEEYVSEME